MWWNIAFSSLDVHISKSTWHFNFFPEQGGKWWFFMSSWGGNKMTSYLRIFRKSNFCKSLPWERNRCVPFCNFNYNQNKKWFTFLNPCRQSFILLEGKCKSWCGHILFVSTAKEDTFLTPDIFTFFFLFWKETYRTLKRVHFWWSDMPQMKLILKRPFTLFTFNATFLAHHQTER